MIDLSGGIFLDSFYLILFFFVIIPGIVLIVTIINKGKLLYFQELDTLIAQERTKSVIKKYYYEAEYRNFRIVLSYSKSRYDLIELDILLYPLQFQFPIEVSPIQRLWTQYENQSRPITGDLTFDQNVRLAFLNTTKSSYILDNEIRRKILQYTKTNQLQIKNRLQCRIPMLNTQACLNIINDLIVLSQKLNSSEPAENRIRRCLLNEDEDLLFRFNLYMNQLGKQLFIFQDPEFLKSLSNDREPLFNSIAYYCLKEVNSLINSLSNMELISFKLFFQFLTKQKNSNISVNDLIKLFNNTITIEKAECLMEYLLTTNHTLNRGYLNPALLHNPEYFLQSRILTYRSLLFSNTDKELMDFYKKALKKYSDEEMVLLIIMKLGYTKSREAQSILKVYSTGFYSLKIREEAKEGLSRLMKEISEDDTGMLSISSDNQSGQLTISEESSGRLSSEN